MSFIDFDNSYAALPDIFYARLNPTAVKKPGLITINHALAETLGIDPKALASEEGIKVLAGNQVPKGATPLAMAYAGHQFGHFTPQLGDGRANLLGEVIDKAGKRKDIQLKGSGPTPFSRMGDGRAAVGPVLREYIVSEGMHALGVPTTRALAAVTTGETVMRDYPLPGAVLTRVSACHIRVGTFQYFTARQDDEAVKKLVDYTLKRLYPELEEAGEPVLMLLKAVIKKQAQLIAQWMSLGFIHGVMNTDNMSIAGETIDYGPCAFMDDYHPQKVFSALDQYGRYAFSNQPRIGQWNLVQFAQCLLPLLSEDMDKAIEKAQEAIDAYPDIFEHALEKGLCLKLGIQHPIKGDLEKAQQFLTMMAEEKADFTRSFRSLSHLIDGDSHHSLSTHAGFDDWHTWWRQRLNEEGEEKYVKIRQMNAVNPAVIPRNHLVEEAIRAAEDDGDFSPFKALTERLTHPYEEEPEGSKFSAAPKPNEKVMQTFCGT